MTTNDINNAFSVAMQEEGTTKSYRKPLVAGANALPSKGKAFSLIVSEKAVLAAYEKEVKNFAALLNGSKKPREIVAALLVAVQNEKRTLRAAGAKESAAVLSITCANLFTAGVAPSLDIVREERTKVQSERKAAKIEKEKAAKMDTIRAIAAKYNIPVEIAARMFEGGDLKA